jgi:MYXO-CTERM domain-containing protein
MRPGRRGRGSRAVAASLIVLGTLAVPAGVRAAIPGMADAPVHWEYAREDFCGIGVDFDTGWVPSGSDVQVRIRFEIGCDYAASLDGKGVLVWPPSTQLYFQGDPRGGEFSQNIGIFFDARIRWDIDIPVVGHFTGEMPIPFVPTIDIGCLDRTAKFTPFLLSGNPDRPAHLLCEIPRILVFEYDLIDLLLPEITGLASAWIRIFLSVDINSYLQGKKILVSEHEQEITEEYGRAFVYPRAAPSLTLNAQYVADLSHQILITIHPEVELEILTFSFGFDIIDVPIPIPEITDEWVFDPAEMTFYFPDISVPDVLDFGATQVGRPRMKRFAVENVGFDDLKVYARSALPFGVDPRLGDPAEDPLTIPAPGMDDIVVSFDPDGEGTANGILRLETNDPDEPWVDVRLTGEATYEDVGEYDDPDDCQGSECSPGYAVTGCGCRTTGSSASGWTAALLLGLAAVLGLSKGRRRRRDS